jgi:hypothetical protein
MLPDMASAFFDGAAGARHDASIVIGWWTSVLRFPFRLSYGPGPRDSLGFGISGSFDWVEATCRSRRGQSLTARSSASAPNPVPNPIDRASWERDFDHIIP